jgi:collagenase-like PrtC family protease
MSTRIEINSATRWDDAALARWSRLGTTDRTLTSVFGSRQQQLVGHGRAPQDIPAVDDAGIVRHAAAARNLGMQFLYLLNGRCEHLDVREHGVRAQLQADLEWIVEEVRADCVVVADLRVAEAVRSMYGPHDVALRVSTIAGVRSPEDLKPWLAHGIDGVVLHHDVGRDFQDLRTVVSFLHREAPSAEVELLLNETCLHGCKARDAHYARLAREVLTYQEGFQQTCNLPKFRDPSLLLTARWIRPEDLEQYTEIGIRRFKIAGREMSSDWLDRAITAYVTGSYAGNLVDLFTMTPPGLGASACDIFYLHNDALSTFLPELKAWRGSEREFYRKYAARLWASGALQVRDDGASYSLTADSVHCSVPGRHMGRLLELQTERDPFFGRRAGANDLVRLGRGAKVPT